MAKGWFRQWMKRPMTSTHWVILFIGLVAIASVNNYLMLSRDDKMRAVNKSVEVAVELVDCHREGVCLGKGVEAQCARVSCWRELAEKTR